MEDDGQLQTLMITIVCAILNVLPINLKSKKSEKLSQKHELKAM